MRTPRTVRNMNAQSTAQPGVNAPPQTTVPPRAPRKPLPGMRDYTQPTPHEQRMEQALDDLICSINDSQLALRTALVAQVQTLDTVVYEHDTQVLPVAAASFTMDLPPQTAQTELITGLYAGIVIPSLSDATYPTIQNAWAQIGEEYVNLAALFSADGTGGMLPGNYAFVIRSEAKREINIFAAGDFPADAFLTFALFGTVVPATLGDVLH
jgi:hypothetical protein